MQSATHNDTNHSNAALFDKLRAARKTHAPRTMPADMQAAIAASNVQPTICPPAKR